MEESAKRGWETKSSLSTDSETDFTFSFGARIRTWSMTLCREPDISHPFSWRIYIIYIREGYMQLHLPLILLGYGPCCEPDFGSVTKTNCVHVTGMKRCNGASIVIDVGVVKIAKAERLKRQQWRRKIRSASFNSSVSGVKLPLKISDWSFDRDKEKTRGIYVYPNVLPRNWIDWQALGILCDLIRMKRDGVACCIRKLI